MAGLSLAIAAAIGAGFSQIGAKLLDEGVIKPGLQPATDQLKKLVGQGYDEAKNDAALQKAIHTVFTDLGIPSEGIDAYIYKLGFRGSVICTSATRDLCAIIFGQQKCAPLFPFGGGLMVLHEFGATEQTTGF